MISIHTLRIKLVFATIITISFSSCSSKKNINSFYSDLHYNKEVHFTFDRASNFVKIEESGEKVEIGKPTNLKYRETFIETINDLANRNKLNLIYKEAIGFQEDSVIQVNVRIEKIEFIAYFTKIIMDTHLVYELSDKKNHIVGTEKFLAGKTSTVFYKTLMDGNLKFLTDAPNAKKKQYYEMFGNRAIWVDGWKTVTLHANRMPWDINKRAPFEDDVWELYNIAEDFSESKNLAEEYPEKLEELKKIFEEEAWANQVYPLYDDMLARLNAVNYVLFGDKKEFTYYAPGAVRIAEKASAPVKGRSHKIEAAIDLEGGEEGVIAACGGMTGGYTMYIKGGKLHFDYNFLDGVHYHLTSPKLPTGPTDLKFNFILDKSKIDGTLKPWSGTGEIYVNGEKVDEDYFEMMHISTYSLA